MNEITENRRHKMLLYLKSLKRIELNKVQKKLRYWKKQKNSRFMINDTNHKFINCKRTMNKIILKLQNIEQ